MIMELTSAAAAGVVDEEGNIFSARARTGSHQRSSFLAFECQIAEIILVELEHVVLTANPILLKDMCRLMQSLLLEHRVLSSVTVSKELLAELARVGT